MGREQRRPAEPFTVSAAEIARRANISRRRVNQMADAIGPRVRVGPAFVYRESDVKRFVSGRK